MNKEEIFDNLPEFTAQDLFKYIRDARKSVKNNLTI